MPVGPAIMAGLVEDDRFIHLFSLPSKQGDEAAIAGREQILFPGGGEVDLFPGSFDDGAGCYAAVQEAKHLIDILQSMYR